MGKGGDLNGVNRNNETFSWEEVKRHTGKDDKWLVINGNIYDITNFSKRHPGGARIISHFAGQDATVPYLSDTELNNE